MSDAEDKCPDIRDPLRLDRCPDCGYMLCGLPASGICPECGAAYTSDMIVLYGWESGFAPRHRRWRLLLQRVSWYWWVAYIGFLLWLRPIHLLSPRTPYDAPLAALLLSPLVVALWEVTRQRRPSPPAPVQLRLTPQGFAMREGFGQEELRPWHGRMGIGLEDLRDGWFRLYSDFDEVHIPWWPGIDIQSDPVTARRIRRRVATWCRRAAEKSS